jgi:hypothetical protein
MRIGLVTGGLADLPIGALLRVAADLGLAMLEFGCGNWSPAPHPELDGLSPTTALTNGHGRM